MGNLIIWMLYGAYSFPLPPFPLPLVVGPLETMALIAGELRNTGCPIKARCYIQMIKGMSNLIIWMLYGALPVFLPVKNGFIIIIGFFLRYKPELGLDEGVM